MFNVSRLAVIKLVIDTMQSLTPPSGIGLQYIDWDDASDIQDVPMTDLIGLNGFAMTDLDRVHDVMFGVSVASYNDPNLFRVSRYADLFYKTLKTGSYFSVWNADTAQKIGNITLYAGTSVSPITRAENRAMQNIVARGRLVLTT